MEKLLILFICIITFGWYYNKLRIDKIENIQNERYKETSRDIKKILEKL